MNVQTLLIIALVSVTIGYVAGMLVTNLRPDKNQPKDPNVEILTESTQVEVARLVRDVPRAVLQVQMEGKRFQKSSELNAIQRKDLEEATVELISWLGYTPAVKEPPPIEDPSTPVVTNRLANKVSPRQTGPLPPPPPIKEQPKSIVNQINDILQEKLEGTHLEARRIRLAEAPNQGVTVQVGLDRYTGVDEVPDEEIRSLIRASVAEWEARTK